MKTKKARRKTIWKAYQENWCPNCAKVVDMEYTPYLKGIPRTQCPECLTVYQVNLMENSNDLLEVPSNYDFKIKV